MIYPGLSTEVDGKEQGILLLHTLVGRDGDRIRAIYRSRWERAGNSGLSHNGKQKRWSNHGCLPDSMGKSRESWSLIHWRAARNAWRLKTELETQTRCKVWSKKCPKIEPKTPTRCKVWSNKWAGSTPSETWSWRLKRLLSDMKGRHVQEEQKGKRQHDGHHVKPPREKPPFFCRNTLALAGSFTSINLTLRTSWIWRFYLYLGHSDMDLENWDLVVQLGISLIIWFQRQSSHGWARARGRSQNQRKIFKNV